MALNRRRLFQKNSFKITTILFAALTLFSCDQLTPLKPHADYSRLIELIRLEDRTTLGLAELVEQARETI